MNPSKRQKFIMKPEKIWLNSLTAQIDFYLRGSDRSRKDANFNWEWFKRLPTARLIDTRRQIKRLLRSFGGAWSQGYSKEWLQENFEKLWITRELLADGLSRRQFDDAIILKIVGYRRFFFPAEAFDQLINTLGIEEFKHPTLPQKYLNSSIFKYKIILGTEVATLIATDGFIEGANSYRQYLVHRGGVDFSPHAGDVILDCGACIGDVGLIFAMLAGENGHVHMFDPMPTHAAFCNLQINQNPHLANRLTVIPKAVGSISNNITSTAQTMGDIRPDAIPDACFPFTSIDDYVSEREIRVDAIKMDIEGGEIAALQGAEETIRKYHPRLLISSYHRIDDLWKIREAIHQIDPSYKFYFGHHTPVQWESVLYAT